MILNRLAYGNVSSWCNPIEFCFFRLHSNDIPWFCVYTHTCVDCLLFFLHRCISICLCICLLMRWWCQLYGIGNIVDYLGSCTTSKWIRMKNTLQKQKTKEGKNMQYNGIRVRYDYDRCMNRIWSWYSTARKASWWNETFFLLLFFLLVWFDNIVWWLLFQSMKYLHFVYDSMIILYSVMVHPMQSHIMSSHMKTYQQPINME